MSTLKRERQRERKLELQKSVRFMASRFNKRVWGGGGMQMACTIKFANIP